MKQFFLLGVSVALSSTCAIAGDLPNKPQTFKIETVRSSDAIDPQTDVLNRAAIRTEVTPNRRATNVEVYTFLIATVAGQSQEIASAYCHTGGPYGPKEALKRSTYAFISCDYFPPIAYVPKGAILTARVNVATAEGARVEKVVRVRVLPRLK